MSDLKIHSHAIVFQEVPNEISLALNISGCPHHCEGCHSPELSQDIGVPIWDELPNLIEKYGRYITCVCFMGGDHNTECLKEALKQVKKLGFKTAVYSGCDTIEPFKDWNGDVWDCIDYLKVGHYDKELGGLSSPTTNQRMYCFDGESEDITEWFQRRR